MPGVIRLHGIRQELRGTALSLGLVGVATAIVQLAIWQTGLTRGTVIYLIPVVIAATRWGLIPALVAAVSGVIAAAYFFFPPYYSLFIRDPQEVLNLLLFIFVAVVVSQLANRLKRQLELARQREIDMRDLYAFSRRLAGAFDVSDIHSAVEDHLATVMQRRVVLFAGSGGEVNGSNRRTENGVPAPVLAEISADRRTDPAGTTVTANGDVWLVRAVSPKNAELGVIAVNLGKKTQGSFKELRSRVDTVLADATATLERLGIAHAIGEARMRAQTDQLREALIDSVSHELRTPLASILGAATVLDEAPVLAGEKKLKALVRDIRNEAERLNNDIQNLLDAARISSEGVKPRTEWAEPADIVHSAIERCRRRLDGRHLSVDVAPALPLIHVDPVLIRQAMVQIIDNATKYSRAGSHISVAAQRRNGQLLLSVDDEGSGLTQVERAQIWDRFARGERHAAIASGSGLGLWIANAFVSANGGSMSAVSEGPDRGTRMTIELPVTQAAVPEPESDQDE
jgi:two-component system sensor histidine kinase KdpD